MFRPGLYQAPRTTFRHYPVLAAVVTAAALVVSALTLPGAGRVIAPRLRPASRLNGLAMAMLPKAAAATTAVPDVLPGHRPVMAVPLTYKVKTRDTLSGIAKAQLGSARQWPVLWWANRHKVANPASLKVGTTLVLPSARPVKPWLLKAALAAIPSPPRAAAGIPGAAAAASAPPAAAPPASPGSLQAYAQSLFGSQYGCAASIIERESGWNVTISNPYSGAYGIPQALPGSKMASAGADWASNGETQLRWMKGYVDSVYGGACAAWSHWQSAGSY